jgi:hypothetical protein
MIRKIALLGLVGAGALTRVWSAVPDDPAKVVPLAVATPAPAFEAREVSGKPYQFNLQALKMLQTYGIDLDSTQGNANHELPVPSVFIVDRGGLIRFRHFNPDYRVRLDAASVLAAARQALHAPG